MFTLWPALRAYTGPTELPHRDQQWLDWLESNTNARFRTCGAGPQRLLEARIAGLEREVELLEEMLAPLPPQG